jgi:membrane-bound metal-dependent hydrolase YbcI (DUF457 family)
MGLYVPVADLLYPSYLANLDDIVHAHNLFLQVAVDLGIPGLIGWLYVFLGASFCVWQLYQVGKKEGGHWAAGLGAGFLGCQAALFTHVILDAVTWGMVRSAPLVWGLWGVMMAAWLLLAVREPVNEPLKHIFSDSLRNAHSHYIKPVKTRNPYKETQLPTAVGFQHQSTV